MWHGVWCRWGSLAVVKAALLWEGCSYIESGYSNDSPLIGCTIKAMTLDGSRLGSCFEMKSWLKQPVYENKALNSN